MIVSSLQGVFSSNSTTWSALIPICQRPVVVKLRKSFPRASRSAKAVLKCILCPMWMVFQTVFVVKIDPTSVSLPSRIVVSSVSTVQDLDRVIFWMFRSLRRGARNRLLCSAGSRKFCSITSIASVAPNPGVCEPWGMLVWNLISMVNVSPHWSSFGFWGGMPRCMTMSMVKARGLSVAFAMAETKPSSLARWSRHTADSVCFSAAWFARVWYIHLRQASLSDLSSPGGSCKVPGASKPKPAEQRSTRM